MTSETPTSEAPDPFADHEGQQYLELLGIGDQGSTLIPGTTTAIRDFLDDKKCREKAEPALKGLKKISPEDPRFVPVRDALVAAIFSRYLRPIEEN